MDDRKTPDEAADELAALLPDLTPDPHDGYNEIPALNWSSLKDLAIETGGSPRLFRYRREHPRRDTEALFFGRAFHCALLEPERFADAYIVEPDFGNCTYKANKANRDAWRESVGRRIILSDGDAYKVANMAKAVRGHRAAMAAMHGAKEETIRWNDPVTGLAMKGRLDILTPRGVTDPKTTMDPAPDAFGRDAAKYLYFGQMAFYHDGVIASGRLVNPDNPLLLAIQKCEPWDVACYRVENEALEMGRALYRRLIDKFVQCTAAEWWPGCCPEIMPLRLPKWIRSEDTKPESEEY